MPEEIKVFYAHPKENTPESEWQTLEDHLKGTAERATEWGYLAGWNPSPTQDSFPEARTSKYCGGLNYAERIHCPLL